jgi:hypothetical protein
MPRSKIDSARHIKDPTSRTTGFAGAPQRHSSRKDQSSEKPLAVRERTTATIAKQYMMPHKTNEMNRGLRRDRNAHEV